MASEKVRVHLVGGPKDGWVYDVETHGDVVDGEWRGDLPPDEIKTPAGSYLPDPKRVVYVWQEAPEINAAIGIVVAAAGREAASKAVAEVLDRLEAGAKAIQAACHSHSGLNCEKDDYGWCYLIAREDVFALIASERPSEKETGR